MSAGAPGCVFWLASPPPTGHSAIAVLELRGDIAAGLCALGVRDVAVHDARVRDVGGLDRVLLARWGEHAASVMAHAGPVAVGELMAFMTARGLTARAEGTHDPREAYPEATSEIEARMLEALSRAASPLAVDVLLAQPARWAVDGVNEAGTGGREQDGAAAQRIGHARDAAARARALNRLIDPPLVAAIGRPNIGKSTLLNALAGRRVSLVHDAPGTTRDYVGCLVNLSGLVVRWLDAPGLDDDGAPGDPIQRAAQQHARDAARTADLVLLCGDHEHEPVALDTGGAITLRVGLRADLGPPRSACEACVCARTGHGVAELVSHVRERLVPQSVIDDPRPWRWW